MLLLVLLAVLRKAYLRIDRSLDLAGACRPTHRRTAALKRQQIIHVTPTLRCCNGMASTDGAGGSIALFRDRHHGPDRLTAGVVRVRFLQYAGHVRLGRPGQRRDGAGVGRGQRAARLVRCAQIAPRIVLEEEPEPYLQLVLRGFRFAIHHQRFHVASFVVC
uniref:Uncharacterized protein n=1 Tax=Anopheles arabiensis TaxID=7173 RepID=A0A182IHU2_ANOAR